MISLPVLENPQDYSTHKNYQPYNIILHVQTIIINVYSDHIENDH